MHNCLLAGLFAACVVAQAASPFVAKELATGLAGGYQVVIADVNGDGKPDIIALASGMTELYWFENPGWQRHTLAAGLKRMINCAFAVVDGKPVVVVASGFENDPSKSSGIVSVLTPPAAGDVREPWTVKEIDRLPSSHRIRTLELDGKTVFLNVPLADPEARPPDYRGHVPLVYYRPGEWKRELIGAQEEGVAHGVWVEGPGRFLIASFVGIHRYNWTGGRFVRTKLTDGDPAAWPKSGSSDVTSSNVTEGDSWIAAIEPWHGNQVVVYDAKGQVRKVIDDSLVDGHTIVAAGPGAFVAGFRGKGTSVFYYERSADGWTKTVLDDHMAAAACAAADLNGDGLTDLACIGTSTANLKLYERSGR